MSEIIDKYFKNINDTLVCKVCGSCVLKETVKLHMKWHRKLKNAIDEVKPPSWPDID